MYSHSFQAHLAVSLVTVGLSFGASISGNLYRRDTAPGSSPNGWTYVGCYRDSVESRLMNAGYYAADDMGGKSCTAFCGSRGYTFAGTQWSRECFCANEVSTNAREADADCNMACTGDVTESCGGPVRLTVYWSGKNASAPSANGDVTGATSMGCYTDNVAARTLSTAMGVPNDQVTASTCFAACSTAGFAYSGVEYGRECWCGQSILNGGAPAQSGCDMVCAANPQEFCGGSSRISIYKSTTTGSPSTPPPVAGIIPSNWKEKGCYTDKVGARALAYAVQTDGGFDNMTINNCLNTCQALNYNIAGLEYAGECWCDNTIGSNGAPASDGCSMNCRGNSAETCGGPDRLNVYSQTTVSPSSTTTTTTTTTATSTTTSATTSSTTTTTSATATALRGFGIADSVFNRLIWGNGSSVVTNAPGQRNIFYITFDKPTLANGWLQEFSFNAVTGHIHLGPDPDSAQVLCASNDYSNGSVVVCREDGFDAPYLPLSCSITAGSIECALNTKNKFTTLTTQSRPYLRLSSSIQSPLIQDFLRVVPIA